MQYGTDEAAQWVCDKCNEKLKPGEVTVTYLGSSIKVELYKCPMCGNVFVDEVLAMGKMLEVEKELEDK
jgi:predicted RNA-binding Zn-ribbon protein involved in translation (DUF1610 family)